MTDDLTPITRLNITTLNINELHEDNKRQKTYEMLIIGKTEIAFLQETHLTPDAIRKWKKVARQIYMALQHHFQSIRSYNTF